MPAAAWSAGKIEGSTFEFGRNNVLPGMEFLEMCFVAVVAGSGLEFVCLCLVHGADVGGDLGEKEQSLDVKGTSVFCSDQLMVGGEQQSFTTTVFWLEAQTFLRTKESF